MFFDVLPRTLPVSTGSSPGHPLLLGPFRALKGLWRARSSAWSMLGQGCVQPQWAGSSQEQPRFEFLFPYMPLSRKLALQENISTTSKVLKMA